MNELLKTTEVAAELRIKVDAVRDLIHSGELDASDVSKAGSKRPRFRVSREALTDYLESRRVQKTPRPARRRRRQQRPADWVDYF